MRILIIGSGGREHALVWKLHQDAPDAEFFITQGNGGTAKLATPIQLRPDDTDALAAWAESRHVDLTVVGPEAPLAAGVANTFARRGLPIFGPTLEAAAIECSKSFSKSLMRDAGVPTAEHASFTDLPSAEAYIRERGAPIVVKASGLAAGKGAIVCETVDEALAAASRMLRDHEFGSASDEIVVEEFLQGEEISVFGLTDGQHALTLPPAQDYKRIGENDTGPNTGGMGSLAPVPSVDDALARRIEREIFAPTLDALREIDRAYRGLLYAGLMLTVDGPKVVEFNARFGDPETQALLPLLDSSLLEPMLALARGDDVPPHPLEWKPGYALTTVLAAAGYPSKPERGKEITIPDSVHEADDLFVFHAGTQVQDGRLATSGGRVLAVTAVAPTLAQAAERSRAAARAIDFEGKQYRRDIGWRELTPHAGTA